MSEIKKEGCSSALIKNLGMIMMVINHFFVAASQRWSFLYIWNVIGTLVSRPAFIFYAFLTAVGMEKTGSRRKYLLSMLFFSLISEIPYDLVRFGIWFDLAGQNVFFCLLPGALAIAAWDRWKEKNKYSALFMAFLLAAISQLINSDYGFASVPIILFFYITRHDPVNLRKYAPAVILTSMLLFSVWCSFAGEYPVTYIPYAFLFEVPSLFALPFICRYNGRKGVQLNKYFYYLFYPLHLLLIWAAVWLT